MYTLIDKSVSIIGTFEISEDKLNAIAKLLPELKLQLRKNNKNELIGRLIDPQGVHKYMMMFSGNRIDYVLGEETKNSRDDLLKMLDAICLSLDVIEDYGINRLAYNSRAFIEDLDNSKRDKISARLPLLKANSGAIETSVRLNYRDNFGNEDINNIISVQDGRVKAKNQENQFFEALLLASDINTVVDNSKVRFAKKDLEQYFSHFIELSIKSYDDVDEFLK